MSAAGTDIDDVDIAGAPKKPKGKGRAEPRAPCPREHMTSFIPRTCPTLYLERGPDGYGISLTGPCGDEPRSGIIVTKSSHADVPAGSRVIEINGVDTSEAALVTAVGLVRASARLGALSLTLRPRPGPVVDPAGHHATLDRPELPWQLQRPERAISPARGSAPRPVKAHVPSDSWLVVPATTAPPETPGGGGGGGGEGGRRDPREETPTIAIHLGSATTGFDLNSVRTVANTRKLDFDVDEHPASPRRSRFPRAVCDSARKPGKRGAADATTAKTQFFSRGFSLSSLRTGKKPAPEGARNPEPASTEGFWLRTWL